MLAVYAKTVKIKTKSQFLEVVCPSKWQSDTTWICWHFEEINNVRKIWEAIL